jgi:hypothetical protein
MGMLQSLSAKASALFKMVRPIAIAGRGSRRAPDWFSPKRSARAQWPAYSGRSWTRVD